MEDDDVAFDPSVGVDVLCCVYPLLEPVYDLANLFDIIDDRDLSSFGILCCQLENTAAVDLEKRSIFVERIAPDHLPDSAWSFVFMRRDR